MTNLTHLPILICAATTSEAAAIRRAVFKKKKSHQIQILRVGMGSQRSAQSLKKALQKRTRMPGLIISCGFARGLSPDLHVGQWIYAINLRSGEKQLSDLEPLSQAWIDATHASAARVITTDEVMVNGVDSKSNSDIEGDAVDMESFALCEVSKAFGIPFGVFRVISDSKIDPLPAFVAHWANLATQNRHTTLPHRTKLFGRALTATIANPPGLLRLMLSGRRWIKALESGWEMCL